MDNCKCSIEYPCSYHINKINRAIARESHLTLAHQRQTSDVCKKCGHGSYNDECPCNCHYKVSEEAMSGLEKVSIQVQRQYSKLYGEFKAGDYDIGATVQSGNLSGIVLWSCLTSSGFTYVVDFHDGMPGELLASALTTQGNDDTYYCGLCGSFMPISHFPH